MSGSGHVPVSSTIRRALVGQFHRPHGLLGPLAGFVLAHRKSNQLRNAWTVQLLDIEPHDRVLELGFGPGQSIAAASALASEGMVVGIDHSSAMLRMASRRNAAAIRAGRVQLLEGTLDSLPTFEAPFDKVFGVNALQFALAPIETLRAIRARMVSGGRIAISQQSRKPQATDRDSVAAAELVAEQLQQVGFDSVSIETLPLEPACAACALATAG